MKVIDLGFAKIPLEGPWPFPIFVASLVWGWSIGYLLLRINAGTFVGPALEGDGQILSEKCAPIAIITILWNVLYRNMLSVQSNTTALLVFQVFPQSNLNQQYHLLSQRFGGNMLEQAPAFLTSIWLYALLVDSASAVPLGYLYLVCRMMYPIAYAIPGEFTVCVEFATTPGYMVIGLYMLGIWTKAMGGDWKDSINDNLLGTSLSSFAIGLMTMLPGLPFGPIYSAVHYFFHQRWRRQKEQKSKD